MFVLHLVQFFNITGTYSVCFEVFANTSASPKHTMVTLATIYLLQHDLILILIFSERILLRTTSFDICSLLGAHEHFYSSETWSQLARVSVTARLYKCIHCVCADNAPTASVYIPRQYIGILLPARFLCSICSVVG